MLCRRGQLPTRDEVKDYDAPFADATKSESIQAEYSYKDSLLFEFIYQTIKQNMLKQVKPIKPHFRDKSLKRAINAHHIHSLL